MFYLINNHFDFIKIKYTLKFKREYNKITKIKKNVLLNEYIDLYIYVHM